MSGAEGVLLVALVFCLFALTVYELALGRVMAENARLRGELFDADTLAIDQARRSLAQKERIRGLELTVVATNPPIDLAARRTAKELADWGFGGSA